VLELMQI